jgi:predicted  nucleic acid-binding Zn-ribbon protein
MSEGESLAALQEQDLAIARAEKSLDELPEKLAVLQLRKRLKDIEAVREKAQAYVRKADAMVSKANDEAAGVQAKIDAEQSKILSGEITNPKELQNITRELDALKRRKDAIEHDELGLIEKAETGQEQLAKVDAALAEGAVKEAVLLDEFKAKGTELTKEIATLKRQREVLAASVPPPLLDRYESLRVSKHGIGVGQLQGDVCSACRTQLPAGKSQSLHAGPEIAECPNCKRILIVREP